MLLASRALCEADAAAAAASRQRHSTLRVLLSLSVRLDKYRRFNRRYFSNRLRKPATGSFAAEMDGRSARPFSLCERETEKENEVNERWQFTIWKQRWSAGARGALL